MADDEVPEAAGNHRRRRLRQRPVGCGDDDRAGEVIVHPFGVDVLAGADGVEDVALGEDARLVVVGIEDHRGADLAPGHPGRRFAQRVVGPDGQHVCAHRVTDLHGRDLPFLAHRLWADRLWDHRLWAAAYGTWCSQPWLSGTSPCWIATSVVRISSATGVAPVATTSPPRQRNVPIDATTAAVPQANVS